MNDRIIFIIFVLMLGSGMFLFSRHGGRLALLAEERHFGMSGFRNAGKKLKGLTSGFRKEKTDREIFDAIGFLRNIIAAGDGFGMTTDTLLDRLSELDGELKPIYLRSLALLRINKREEMIAYFSDAADTQMSNDFIRILAQWDSVAPEKLASTLLSYQNTMKEIRTTSLKRKTEMLSDILFFPVVINVLIILMNFIFITYFIEQRELLGQLFF